MAGHSIKSPDDGDVVPAINHPDDTGDVYYIEADGKPDNATMFTQIIAVYGKVFPTKASVPKITEQDKILQMIHEIPLHNGCRRGRAFQENSIWKYEFRDGTPYFNSLPVPNIDSNDNYLQVYVLFRGGVDYIPATVVPHPAPPKYDPIQFKPTS